MKLKKSQQNLRNWTKQDWRTGSGKRSTDTGEAYFPSKAVEALKKAGLYDDAVRIKKAANTVSYTHLTLPTNREV